jgi:hypothetical protein
MSKPVMSCSKSAQTLRIVGVPTRPLARLTQDPPQAGALLGRRLAQFPPLDAGRVALLIADLDSNDFAVREKASAELAKYGVLAAGVFHKALARNPSLEVKHRLQQLLTKPLPLPPECVQANRALEVLERLADPGGRQVLEEVVRRLPETWLAYEANATLDRMNRQVAR